MGEEVGVQTDEVRNADAQDQHHIQKRNELHQKKDAVEQNKARKKGRQQFRRYVAVEQKRRPP